MKFLKYIIKVIYYIYVPKHYEIMIALFAYVVGNSFSINVTLLQQQQTGTISRKILWIFTHSTGRVLHYTVAVKNGDQTHAMRIVLFGGTGM